MMQRRACSQSFVASFAASIAMVTFAWSAPVMAAAPRVLIAGPTADTLTQRIEREVASLGMETVRGDDTTGCSLAAVAARAGADDVRAVLCTNGNVVLVWSVTRTGVTLEEVLLPPEPDTPIAILAMRAAEVARTKTAADLVLSERRESREPPSGTVSREPLRPALGDLPGVVSPSGPAADAPSVDEAPPSDAPRVPKAVVGAGFGTLVGGSIPNATFSGQLEVGLTQYVAPFLRADLPIDSGTAAAFATSTGLVTMGASVPLAGASSVLIPRLSLGAGTAWLAVSGADRNSSFSTNQRLYSLVVLGGVNVSTRIAGPVRVVADGLLGATTSRLVVASPTRGEIADWGQPVGTIAVRAEVVLQ